MLLWITGQESLTQDKEETSEIQFSKTKYQDSNNTTDKTSTTPTSTEPHGFAENCTAVYAVVNKIKTPGNINNTYTDSEYGECDKTGECQDVQNYLSGITWRNATSECGDAGLEHNVTILTQLPALLHKQFWIGIGIYQLLSPWMEVLVLHSNFTIGFNNGMCVTLECSGKTSTLHEEDCNSDNPNIQGLCEDGNNSSTIQSWGLPYSSQLRKCKIRDLLLVPSTICTKMSIARLAWTNIYRENIEIELPGGDNTRIPVQCLSAYISETNLKDIQISKENCTLRLHWFVCQKSSTSRQLIISSMSTITVETEEELKVHYNAFTGAVAGGTVTAITVLLIVTSLVVCKLRGIGPFNDKCNFTRKPYNDETKTDIEVNTKQQINHTYGIVNDEIRIHTVDTNKPGNTNMCYAQVNRNRNVEDTYIESVDGEYDHFNLTDRRREETIQNTYDSNIGIRSCEDQTYDTTSRSRKLNSENVYDHSFSNMISESDYNQSVSVMTETSMYDKAY
ncbi:unnamed protein product [Mytilus coruscus]|uniref:Uncharacterized protein n=1 Tax=Mytilus coruscus TaxID=42192 RepID=A0A6J8ET40_MYTCO|nr:unnamed protein product [Mytilus coruscus]